MKTFTIIAKVVAALAAVAGIVYVVATYGDKIVAWAKKLLGHGCCCCADCECADCECNENGECTCECKCACEEADEDVEVEVVAEEVVEAEATTKECPFCCSTIAINAKRCPNCTSELG